VLHAVHTGIHHETCVGEPRLPLEEVERRARAGRIRDQPRLVDRLRPADDRRHARVELAHVARDVVQLLAHAGLLEIAHEAGHEVQDAVTVEAGELRGARKDQGVLARVVQPELAVHGALRVGDLSYGPVRSRPVQQLLLQHEAAQRGGLETLHPES
jgi:hypothetical protein